MGHWHSGKRDGEDWHGQRLQERQWQAGLVARELDIEGVRKDALRRRWDLRQAETGERDR